MVGRIRVDGDVHVRPAALTDEVARNRARSAGGEDPVDAVVDLPADRFGPAGSPGEPGHRDRIRVHLAVGVPEARVRIGPAHRPVEGERDLRPDGGDGRRPIEMRRRVEVPGQEDGDPVRGERGQGVEVHLGGRQPDPALERVQPRWCGAVPHPVGAVRRRGQVGVGDRHDPPGPELDVDIDAVARRRVDQPVARDDLEPLAGEPAEGAGNPLRRVLRLLEPDDVRAGRPDRLEHLGERRLAAAALRAPVAGSQVELVAAVEDVQRHHAEAHAALALVGSRRRRRRERRADQEPSRERPQAPPGDSMPGDGNDRKPLREACQRREGGPLSLGVEFTGWESPTALPTRR